MSPYLATSEMSRFNTVQTRDWVPLSPNFHATLTEAKRVAELTQGAFDPTLGGIVGRYGFGPITAAPAGAFADLSLTATAARKAHRAQTVDLCGIAKGYALDLIVSRLAALGLRDIFVELGGEVMTLGQHPEGRPWRAGVERPLPGATTVQCAVSVAGEALATSGDRVNSFVHAGRRYGHIIDPLSHRPAAGDLASVSVFAPRAMTADALATALFAMGAELGVAFAEAQGIPALFLTRDGPDLRETATGGFAARIIG
jgi:thiamine biosynthesis lipoprotein